MLVWNDLNYTNSHIPRKNTINEFYECAFNVDIIINNQALEYL